MPQQLRPLAAEFVGTLLFVSLGVGSVVASSGPLGGPLAHAVGMAIIVSMTRSLVRGREELGVGRGRAIVVETLVAGGATGAVMKPARAFGPALIAGQWDAHAVYWIGPLIGAGVAGALWKAVLLPRR